MAPGAESLGSFTDPKDPLSRTSIIVGAESGLHVFGGDKIAFGSLARSLVSNPMVAGAKNIQVVQDNNILSIWATNQNDELAYVLANLRSLDETRTAVLISAGRATAFASALLAPGNLTSARQVLITNDVSGNLTLLEQSLDTGIWREEPFYVDSATSCISLKSYTMNLSFRGEKSAICKGSAFIRTSSSLTTVVNGRLDQFSPQGKWYPLDVGGELCIIVAANGLVSQPFTVDKIRDAGGKEISFKSQLVDPANKTIGRMASVTSVDGLKNARTKDGKSLWEGASIPSDDDLKAAAQCLGAIKDAHNTLPEDGSRLKAAIATPAATTPSSVQTYTSQGFFADLFHWIKQKASDAADWIVKKTGTCNPRLNMPHYALTAVQERYGSLSAASATKSFPSF